MNDFTLKRIVGFTVRHHMELSKLLSYFKAEDLENGIIALPEKLVNNELRPYILLQTAPYLDSYSLQFSGGMLHLQAMVNVKQLGPLSIRYMLEISSFTFDGTAHRFVFKYYEDIRSEGSIIQKTALKALSLRGSYIKHVAELLHLDFLEISDGILSVDLDKTGKLNSIPDNLSLGFIASEGGVLKLSYRLTSSDNIKAVSSTGKPKPKVQGGYLKDMLNYSDRF